MSRLRIVIAATLLTCAALLAGAAPPSRAHELWVAPEDFAVEMGEEIIADLRVGEDFKGEVRAYLPFLVDRLEVTIGDETRPVEGRMGDIPAMRIGSWDEGLAIAVFVSKGSQVEYDSWEMFETFLASKGLEAIADQHRARGLPEANFTETYRRFAKSLVQIGAGAGEDRAIGLEAELVALANPYLDDVSGGLAVRFTHAGAAVAEAPVSIWARDAAGNVSRSQALTDAAGVATVAVEPGRRYLVAAVVMKPAEPSQDTDAPVWESLWPSLTFAVPDSAGK